MQTIDSNQHDTLPLERARSRLSAVWFIGSGVTFFLLMIQSLVGKFGSDTQQVWSWFVPSVVPTLSLMISVLGASAMGHAEKRRVQFGFYRIALWLTISYLIVLFATLLAASARPPAIDTLLLSNAWLGPLQGLVVAAIAFLFISKHSAKSPR
jgi:hypothetical protein